jgi:hypothetical protein
MKARAAVVLVVREAARLQEAWPLERAVEASARSREKGHLAVRPDRR